MVLLNMLLILNMGLAATGGIVSSEVGFDGAVSIVSEESTDGLSCVTVNVPFLDIHGQPKMGQARLYVREELLKSGKPIPLTCYTHYEADAMGIQGSCGSGWAVVTPHYGTPETGGFPAEFLPAGNSYNLARSIIQWARRLPFVDRTHLHTVGGSAGGYLSLAMSAEFFPVSSTFAGQPLFNWAYNINYIYSNQPVAKKDAGKCDDSPLPVLCLVTSMPDEAFAVFGNDLASDTWYYLSPLSYLDRITCPVVVICATGDILTPAQQMSRNALRPLDTSLFPEGYIWDFDTLTKVEPARKTLEEALSPEKLFIHTEPLPAGAIEISREQGMGHVQPPTTTALIDLPWSRDKQWSLMVLEEGPPLPHSSHWRYNWMAFPGSFQSELKIKTPNPSILNEAKLTRLMERYTGAAERHIMLADGTPISRLNFRPLEQLDVVTGLLDYAGMGPEHEARLKTLYAANTLKPFGETLALDALTNEREKLLQQLSKKD